MLTLFLAPLLALAPLGDPFVDLDYDAAVAKAKADGKLLLVDFTASWCGPCKKMEKDTWANAEVRTWLGQHALALQIDVDRQKDVARRFEIQAMPTVIALKDGAELDRFVGYRDAQGFLGWGNGVLAGKTTKVEFEARVKELATSDDVDARFELAKELARARRYDEALQHYLWLWPASRSAPGMGGVRTSFMLGQIVELASKHEPTKKAFLAILDETQARVEAAELPTFEDWQDWSALCENFRELPRIVAWYERKRDADGVLFAGRGADAPEQFRVQHITGEVFEVLMRERRPLDAVRLYGDARERARQIVEEHESRAGANEGLDEETRNMVEQFGRNELIERMSDLYAALLVAGRADEADAVSAMLLATLDAPESRIGLVRAGLEVAERPEPIFARWLDEAEAKGGKVDSVRRKLARLAKKPAAEVGGGK